MTQNVPLRSRAGSVRVAVMTIVASIAMGLLLAGPASATEKKNELLQLSRDGVNFATDALPTMFGSTKGYVPGESRRGIIWVRNASNQPAQLSLAVRNTDMATASELPGHLRLQAQSPGRGETAAALPQSGACTPVIDGWTLAGGEVLPLTLDLGMELDAPNVTRKQGAEFTMIFVLQESGAGQRVGHCSGSPGTAPAVGSQASIVVGGAPSGTGTGGTVAGGDEALNSNGAEAGGNGSQSDTGLDMVQSGNQFIPDAEEPRPLVAQLQSNVEATVYNPWPWILVISACVYIFTSVRKRSSTR